MLEPNFIKSSRFNLGLLFEQAAFYGLLIIIFLAAIPYGTVDPLFKSLLVFLICIAAVFRILEGIINDSPLFTDFLLFAPLLGILLIAVIQIIPLNQVTGNSAYADNHISLDSYETKDFILIFSGILLAGQILLRYTTTKRRLLALIYLVLSVGIISMTVGLVRRFFFTEEFLLPGSGGFAQFVNKNHFVFLMEMTSGVLLGLLLKAKLPDRLKLFFWVMFALLCFAIISANSRGGILSTVGLILFAVFVYFLTKNIHLSFRNSRDSPSSKTRGYFKATLAALLFTSLFFGMTVYLISFVGGDPIVNRMETIQSETAENNEKRIRRREFWQSTIKLIKANPVTGIGFGAYPVAITEYDESSGQFSLQQAHNDYLELIASGGIAAFLLLLIFVAVLIKRICRQFAAADSLRQASCFGAAIGLVGISLHSLTDFGLHTIINALICMVLIVMATANITVADKS